MNISILCIGDELLKGSTVNTNQAYIGQQLLKLGIIAENSLVVADDKQALINAFDFLFKSSDMVIATGGLGPTADDMTKQIAAEYLGLGFVENQQAADNLKAYWAKRHEHQELPEFLFNQAQAIEGADVLQNSQGTAPGMWVKTSKSDSTKYLVMLPGPPREMNPMFDEEVFPRIESLCSGKSFNQLYYIAGVPESIVEQKMQPVIARYPGLSVAYCASYDGVKLFLKTTSESVLDEVAGLVIDIFDGQVLPEGKTDIAADIVRIMNEKQLTVSTAESCTGGLIASRITDIPGSSAVFPGGLVVYCNEWKHDLVDVDMELFEQFGAVSGECVNALAHNLTGKFGTDAGIAVSGIAGPGGATPYKPVGLVYLAVKFRDECRIERFEFTGNRKAVRDRAAAKALNILREMILTEV